MAIKFEERKPPRAPAASGREFQSIIPSGFAERIAKRLERAINALPLSENINKTGNGNRGVDREKLLVESVVLGDVEKARGLLDSGGDANMRDSGGWTLMMNAAQGGNLRMAEMLASKNARLDEVNPMGWTALMCAAVNGKDDVAIFLLSAGADATLRDRFGNKASRIAMENGYHGLAAILRENEEKG